MYLLDSNIYINFYDRYYRKEFFPSFWENLPQILNASVIIPDIVIAENYQDSFLKNWLNNNYTKSYIRHKEFANSWGAVLVHIQNCGYYKEEALISDKGWAHERIADPWLIAIAKEKDYTIVTSELSVPSLSKVNPSRSAKIPDVCKQLKIRCIDMNQFFREVELSV
ncbi:DUF4411 family protein [Streptococcus mutans]|uniref:DUF4411 family protein n=1 Tax=Streptococcus mutans TaxID=1309 RepID=UPI0002B596E0|nr:DUF4411 family protein [Streptococcus mutans]EMC52961.1 hypothetical protein SMU104_00305 [Streptococcus mutans SA41]EMC59144.1 hypothetical protein SMU107_01724 [Streptococcus mutans R221]MCB4951771.1 DUF4411 family protein [Streptococcus mutans]MCB5056481.1 DUF4411 family protein [Streptococcus mutans]MCB5095912.1 DUF4411 family protein [Streptococcus mutans]